MTELLTNGSIPAKVGVFAQRLYEQGFNVEHIKKSLARYGYDLREEEIRTWVDPQFARAREVEQRRAAGRWQEKLDRMQELRRGGLPYTQIAKVMRIDYGISLTGEVVRGIVKGRTSLPRVRHLLADAPASVQSADPQHN